MSFPSASKVSETDFSTASFVMLPLPSPCQSILESMVNRWLMPDHPIIFCANLGFHGGYVGATSTHLMPSSSSMGIHFSFCSSCDGLKSMIKVPMKTLGGGMMGITVAFFCTVGGFARKYSARAGGEAPSGEAMGPFLNSAILISLFDNGNTGIHST